MALTKATQNVIVPDIVTTNTTQTITGTKTFTSTIVGNTATTTKLITARTINGIAFDGTANITIPTGGSSSVKAWINFNGTLSSPITPRAQYNVSSVTKNAVGDYTLNFATPMVDANYSIAGIAYYLDSSGDPNSIYIASLTTSSCNIFCGATSLSSGALVKRDSSFITLQIFGN